MRKETIVSNASPLIGLSILRKLDLLKSLYNEVLIPQAVYREVVVDGAEDPGAEEVKRAIEEGWMRVLTVKDKVAVTALMDPLSDGEAETIILALEKDIPQVIIDEKAARKKAEIMGLEVIGTLGILLLGMLEGVPMDMKKEMDRLRKEGFRISNELCNKILK